MGTMIDDLLPKPSRTASNAVKKELENGMPVATTTTTLFFITYIVIWCLHLLIPLVETKVIADGHGAYDNRPIHPWDCIALYPLVFTILLATFSKNIRVVELAVAAHVLDLVIKFQRMPALWDHEYWGMLTQISFVLAYSPYRWGGRQKEQSLSAEPWFQKSVQLQYGTLYAAAAFWKLNTSFFDHQTSCGSLLLLELVGSYVSPFVDLSKETVVLLAKSAPTVTFIGESAIAIFMLLFVVTSTRLYRDIGVSLAIFFHTTVILLPMNAAGGFTLSCMSRFIIFFNSTEISRLATKMRNDGFLVFTCFLAVTMGFSLTALRYFIVGVLPDTGLVANGILCALYALLVSVQPSYLNEPFLGSFGQATMYKGSLFVVVVITVSYAFLTPILGIQQMGASTMYGNLRNYGPSNHFFVPTAVLGDDILFGGGLVRVIESNSATLNLKFGHIRSIDVFPERVVQLAAIGRSGPAVPSDYPIQVFPYVMTSPHSRGQVMDAYLRSKAIFEKEQTFLPYILPITTVGEALREAADAGEEFTVTLADAGTSSRVIVDIDCEYDSLNRMKISTNLSCSIVQPDGTRVGNCVEDSMAAKLLYPVPLTLLQRITKKLLIPYPRLVIPDGEICIT